MVEQLQVRETNGDFSETGAVVWELRRTARAQRESEVDFVMSKVPEGWIETVEPQVDMPNSLIAKAHYSDGKTDYVNLSISDLRSTELKVEPSWYRGERFVTPQRFSKKNVAACNAGF